MKLCKNCKFMVGDWCEHPSVKRIDLVTGAITGPNCYDRRKAESAVKACGEIGLDHEYDWKKIFTTPPQMMYLDSLRLEWAARQRQFDRSISGMVACQNGAANDSSGQSAYSLVAAGLSGLGL